MKKSRLLKNLLGAVAVIVIVAALVVSVYLKYKENSYWWNQ